jgi:hypothetical protein
MVAMEIVPGKIQPGDSVKHGPTGESWFVLGVREQKNDLCMSGWPPAIARLSDCTLVEKGKGINLKEREYRNNEFGGNWDDERQCSP